MRHVLRSFIRAIVLLTFVVLGLEVGLHLFHRGAFEEPNFYQADDALGLRLIPNTQMRLAYLGVTPYTDVHINDQGYRGPAHPPAGDGDIVVIGDSLAFGLGVRNDQTFPAVLQGMLGAQAAVINYGVPSYTMTEQTAVLDWVLDQRRAPRVVYTISVGRFLAAFPEPIDQPFRIDHGWLIEGTSRPAKLSLPGPVVRFSHLVNLFRQGLREPSRDALMRRVVESRTKFLLVAAARASQERSRMAAENWFDLVGPDGQARAWSHLLPALRDVKKRVDGRATQVTFLLLPQDFMLHDASWKKYELPATDMSSAHILIEDFTASATALGFDVVDASRSVQAAGPETTRPRDWHFSPLGHQVIAETLANHFGSQ